MKEVDPRLWLTDVLLRIDTHPAEAVHELTPRLWKTLFADTPMTSDVTDAGVVMPPAEPRTASDDAGP